MKKEKSLNANATLKSSLDKMEKRTENSKSPINSRNLVARTGKKDSSVTAPERSIGQLSKTISPAPIYSEDKSANFFNSRRRSSGFQIPYQESSILGVLENFSEHDRIIRSGKVSRIQSGKV